MEKLPDKSIIHNIYQNQFNIQDSADKIKKIIVDIIQMNNIDSKKILRELSELKIEIQKLNIKIDTLLSLKNGDIKEDNLDEIISSFQFLLETKKSTKQNLVHKIKELNKNNEILLQDKKALEIQINYDALTKVFNRRKFNELLEKAFNATLKWKKENLTIVLIDLDDFKKVNDTYGHITWDKILQLVWKTLKDFLQVDNSTAVFRYWWEEFAVLSRLHQNQIKNMLLKVMDFLSTNPVDSQSKKEWKIYASFSAWIWYFEKDTYKNTDEFIHNADQKLYKAKDNGKGQIVT